MRIARHKTPVYNRGFVFFCINNPFYDDFFTNWPLLSILIIWHTLYDIYDKQSYIMDVELK